MANPEKLFVSKKWAKKLPKGGISPGGAELINAGSGQNVFADLNGAAAAAIEADPANSEIVILDDIFAGKKAAAWDNVAPEQGIKHFSSSDEGAKEIKAKESDTAHAYTAQSKLVSARTLKLRLGEDENGAEKVTLDGFKNVELSGKTAISEDKKAESAVLLGGGIATVTHSWSDNTKKDSANTQSDKSTLSASAGGSLTLKDKAVVDSAYGWFAEYYANEGHKDSIDPDDEDVFNVRFDFVSDNLTIFDLQGDDWNPLDYLPGYNNVTVSGGASAGILQGGSMSMNRAINATFSKDFENDATEGAYAHDRKVEKSASFSEKAAGKLTISGENSFVEEAYGYAAVTISGKGECEYLDLGDEGNDSYSAKSTYVRNAAKKTEKFTFNQSESVKAAGKLTLDDACVNEAYGYASAKLTNNAWAGCVQSASGASEKISLVREYTSVTAADAKDLKSEKYQSSGSTSLSGSFTAAGGAEVEWIENYKSVTIGDKKSRATVTDSIRGGDGDNSFTESYVTAWDKKENLYKQTYTASGTAKPVMTVKISNGSSVSGKIRDASSVTVRDSTTGDIITSIPSIPSIPSSGAGKHKDIFLLSAEGFSIPESFGIDESYEVMKQSAALKSVVHSFKMTSYSTMTVTLTDAQTGDIKGAKKVTASAKVPDSSMFFTGDISSDGKDVVTEEWSWDSTSKKVTGEKIGKVANALKAETWTANGLVSLTNINCGSIENFASVTLKNAKAGSISAGSYTKILTADKITGEYNYGELENKILDAFDAADEVETSFGTLKLTDSCVTGDIGKFQNVTTAGTTKIEGSVAFLKGKNSITFNGDTDITGDLTFDGGVSTTVSVSKSAKIAGNLSFGDGENTLKVSGLLKIGGAITTSNQIRFNGSGDIAMIAGGEDQGNYLKLLMISGLQGGNDEEKARGYVYSSGKEGKGLKIVRFASLDSMEGFQGVKWEQADDTKARKAKPGEFGWLSAPGDIDDYGYANFSDMTDILSFQLKKGEEDADDVCVVLNFDQADASDKVFASFDGGTLTEYTSSHSTISCDCSDGKKHTLKLTLGEENKGCVSYNIEKRHYV